MGLRVFALITRQSERHDDKCYHIDPSALFDAGEDRNDELWAGLIYRKKSIVI
jgi:hypothetical protein